MTLENMDSFARDYFRARKPHFQQFPSGNSKTYQTPANVAFRNIRTRAAFRALEWDEHSTPEIGEVRLRIVPDECVSLDDLFGDTFNPEVNSDIPRDKLEKQKQEEIDRVNRDGVWGVIGEYFDGESWQHADSCYGFIGDDWKDSGYDVDIMAQTLDAARKIETCPACHRPLKHAN